MLRSMRVDGSIIKSHSDKQDEGSGTIQKTSVFRTSACSDELHDLPNGANLRSRNPRSALARILIIWWVCGNGAQAASKKALRHEYIGGAMNKGAIYDGLQRQLLQTEPSEDENDVATVAMKNWCLIVFVGLAFVSPIVCLVKQNWRKCFPASPPPEPWLLIEDADNMLRSSSEGKKSKGSQKLRSPFEQCGPAPVPVSKVSPAISRSLRATRSCTSRKVIDSGRFGCVEKGQFVDAAGKKHDVAVKIAKLPPGQDPDIVVDTFKAEIEIFERIPLHPNVIRCFGGRLGDCGAPGVCIDEFFIVEELMDVSLREIITGRTPWETWTYRIILRIFRDIAAGLEHLHAHNVSHYDLKPENVLVKVVDEVFPLQIKLADFGCSQIKHSTYATAKYAGTKQYMAPEIAWCPYFSLIASGKVDIFSLGILMWEILTGENLISRVFPTVSEVEPLSIQAVLDCPCEQRWPIADHHPLELSTLIWSCVEFDSSNRPTAKMVLRALEGMMNSEWVGRAAVREGVMPAIINTQAKSTDLAVKWCEP
ncbi:hypothetical protein BSKO_05942 [Bryopsis sp. KO-2023]|nr:hypothetical protein BSKO_05942 [Bryopsis sp. KO-2023]